MTKLEQEAADLEARVEHASYKERIKLQPRLDRVVTTLTAHGLPVSRKLRNINQSLKDEAIEDMFDNLPV